ncbi:MAG: CvpA family protein [Bacteroidota bacterium]
MHVLDLFILIAITIFVFRGFRKGLIIELATLAALVLGVMLAKYFSDLLAQWLVNECGMDAENAPVVSFVAIFVVVLILVRILAKAIEKVLDMTALGFFNKMGGAILGLAKALLLLAFIFYILLRFDTNETLLTARAKEKSVLFRPISRIAPALIPKIKMEYKNLKKNDSIRETEPTKKAIDRNFYKKK